MGHREDYLLPWNLHIHRRQQGLHLGTGLAGRHARARGLSSAPSTAPPRNTRGGFVHLLLVIAAVVVLLRSIRR